MRNVDSARTAASVVLVGLDNDAIGMVRETLAAEAVLPSSSTSFGDAIAVVKRMRPDVVIVGFGQSMDAALALGQALQKEAPSVTLVAMADRSDAEAILAAMRVGYKEFVVLPDDGQRLRQVVHEAAYAPADDEEKGLVVTVCGAKGGVGATVIASHLASELAAIHRVIVLDLDFGMGDVAPVMDVSPKDTITDLLPRAESIDERMLTGAVAVHRSKVHVLAQPAELTRVGQVHPDDVFAIINAAAKGYQFVIIDIGMYLDEAAAMALGVSDTVVLITTPDVVAVRDGYRRMKLLQQMGIEKERIRLVVNRYHRQAFVNVEDIQRSLGLKVMGTVADDGKTVDQAINEGKLIREVNRKSEAARDISALVALLTEDIDDEPDRVEEPSGKGFFSSLFNRG